MGNRVVWGFKNDQDSPVLYLYAHWAHEDGEEQLRAALNAARPRWGDSDYATRICISALIGDQWAGLLGFGLSVDTHATPDNPVLVVDWHARTVTTVLEGVGVALDTAPLEQFAGQLQEV